MNFIILPIEDAAVVFTAKELETMRKSIDCTEVIVHEEKLVDKRNQMGLTTLPSEETGTFEWTYPVYNSGNKDLYDLLNSDKWSKPEEV